MSDPLPSPIQYKIIKVQYIIVANAKAQKTAKKILTLKIHAKISG